MVVVGLGGVKLIVGEYLYLLFGDGVGEGGGEEGEEGDEGGEMYFGGWFGLNVGRIEIEVDFGVLRR